MQGYIDAIAPEHRPLFDRVDRLILTVHPDALVSLSYKMPTYKVGDRRLFVGAWKHGFHLRLARRRRQRPHPPLSALKTSKGTLNYGPRT